MICTCDNCHYTFESPSLPSTCPDCGKETINHRVEKRIISAPAVRPANNDEIAWHAQVQEELASEQHRKESMDNLDSYGMTDDEYNWAMVLLYVQNLPSTDEGRQFVGRKLAISLKDAEKTLEYYQLIRRIFTRRIGEDRKELEKSGLHRPVMVTHINEDGEMILRDDLDQYGPALSILYRFRPYDFLHTPTLGNLRRIDLKKISEEPSAGYAQFILDCLG